MKNKYPLNKQLFDDRLKSLLESGCCNKIPVLAAHSCESILSAYYGGLFKAGAQMIWKSISRYFYGMCVTLTIRFCDLMGWSKCKDGLRHGKNCDTVKCLENYSDCISKDIPKWYKKLTGWVEME